MANTTTRVNSSTTPWGQDTITRDLYSTAQTYYPGAMMAINSSGYATKCDDSSGLQFDGIMATTRNVTVESGDASGDHQVVVERPFRFTMKIASVAITDIGSKVYALYDNEVALTGVSNSILVGWIDDVISATEVLIKPHWALLSANAVASNTMTFAGVTGANTIVMPDNLADALSVVQGANSYLTFVTTDSSEVVLVKKTLKLNTSIALQFPTAGIIQDTSGNELIKFPSTVSSAVNEITVSNAATTASPIVQATGGDTNISLKLTAKATGVVERVQADGAGGVGLVTPTTITTAGAVTYTIAQLKTGLILRDPNGASRSDVTPTGTNIAAGLPGVQDGAGFEFTIKNDADAAEVITVTAGTDVTLTGDMAIGQNELKRFLLVVTSVSSHTVTIYSFGSVAHNT